MDENRIKELRVLICVPATIHSGHKEPTNRARKFAPLCKLTPKRVGKAVSKAERSRWKTMGMPAGPKSMSFLSSVCYLRRARFKPLPDYYFYMLQIETLDVMGGMGKSPVAAFVCAAKKI